MNENTKMLSDIDIAVYALYALGGWQQRVHTEDIALKCFQLAPSRFSWVKYRQYPDLMSVWWALGDAKKTKYGSLVIGGSERKRGGGKDSFGGWRLTSSGVSWINENQTRIEKALGATGSPKGRLVEDRRLKELLKSPAYGSFNNGEEPSKIGYAQFVESLTCTVNTSPQVLNERIEQLYASATILNQQTVTKYLDFGKVQFSKQIFGGA